MSLGSVQSVLTNGFEQIPVSNRGQMTRIASGWQLCDPDAWILPMEISNQVQIHFSLAINPKRHGEYFREREKVVPWELLGVSE